MVRLAAESGLRRGELLGLTWGDIDADARRVTVQRSISQEGGVKEVRPPKSGRARRSAISHEGAEALGRWQAALAPQGGSVAPGAPVFPGRDGSWA